MNKKQKINNFSSQSFKDRVHSQKWRTVQKQFASDKGILSNPQI